MGGCLGHEVVGGNNLSPLSVSTDLDEHAVGRFNGVVAIESGQSAAMKR